jgi:protein ImuB
MSKLYACIIVDEVKRDGPALLALARDFAYAIEMLEDGILFDVSGLQKLMGPPDVIAQRIAGRLKAKNLSGRVALADRTETAILLARQQKGLGHTIATPVPAQFQQLSLRELPIENDTLNILNDLGIRRVEELQQIPADELVRRYGPQFRDVIDVIEQKVSRLLTRNVQENRVNWAYDLDLPVEDFEQLILIVNNGLEHLLRQVDRHGFSTEQLDIRFRLRKKQERNYEIKTSFPTLERAFWLKLINLRIALDPPEDGIAAIKITAHFTRPRPAQSGLYAVSRPHPESLLLTINKLKKLAGEECVGVPALLNQRQSREFVLETEAVPAGKERIERCADKPVIAFSYFDPPVEAEVEVYDKQLLWLKTPHFSGRVQEYSGVWRRTSRWWGKQWKTEEWDVEIEDLGVYRLCKTGQRWYLTGEYD